MTIHRTNIHLSWCESPRLDDCARVTVSAFVDGRNFLRTETLLPAANANVSQMAWRAAQALIVDIMHWVEAGRPADPGERV